MAVLLPIPILLILIGSIYAVICLRRRAVLEATTWGLLVVIGFLILFIFAQASVNAHMRVKLISLEGKIKALEGEIEKEESLNRPMARDAHFSRPSP